MNKVSQFAFVSLASVFISACASMSAGNFFSHYSAQNQSVYAAVRAGQYQEAEAILPEYVAGDILDNLEKGRVTFLNAEYKQSQSYFELSETAVRAQQDQAVVSISEAATDVGSLAVNDNLKTYIPADYELGFLHLYLGLNYLHKNSLEGALVEVRKANQVQEQAKKAREDDLESAAEEMQGQGMSANLGSVLSQYPDAGDQLQAVQNGYLFYLSALLYETANELNNAYVDYRRALAVMPDNKQVIDGAVRVAKKLGMKQDLELLTKQYGEINTKLPEGSARIIVIDEQGVVLQRNSWKLTMPVYTNNHGSSMYSLSLPFYDKQPSEHFNRLKLGDKVLSESKLVDVNLMAQQDLTERMPSIIMRQALRVVVKEQMRREGGGSEEEIASLLINVWNTLTEQPDTRSWQTLPGAVYSSSAVVHSGQHRLNVDGQSYDFDVKEGHTALVWLSRQGNNATIWHKQLGTL